jgi:hypothetical protein
MTAKSLPLALLASLLTGCAGGGGPAGSLTDSSSPIFQIKTHYERTASEENGVCRNLLFQEATRVDVLADTPEELVLQVRYSYSPTSRRTARGVRSCVGFGERIFTLARSPDGYRVVEMSDPL